MYYKQCFTPRNIFKFIGIAIVIFCGIALFGFAVMYLWNALIPDLFHGPHLSYWQAFGLLILSKIFFGRGWHKGKGHRHHMGEWRNRITEKFASMTPEEREAFKANLKNSCRGWGKTEAGV